MSKIFSNVKEVTSKILGHKSSYYSTRELANNSTTFLQTNQDEYMLRTRKTKRLLILILSHAFAAVLIFSDPRFFINAFNHFSVDTLFFGLFVFIALPFAWYHYFDNTPELTISEEGILIKNEGLFYWGMISETVIKEVEYNGLKQFLILNISYGNIDPQEVKTEITYLDRSTADIAQIIEKFKNKVGNQNNE